VDFATGTVEAKLCCDHDNFARDGGRLTGSFDSRRLVAMDVLLEEFQLLVAAVLVRYCAQNSWPVAPEQPLRVALQLADVVHARGLPLPLRDDEIGAPGGMPEQECSSLVERVMDGVDDPKLADAVRQLVKACFYPEFKVCRDSFREVASDGTCRRQQLDRAIKRVSGAHCVDCPHWIALTPGQHVAYLRNEWCGDSDVFERYRDVFLPEDFRRLRRWLRAAARTGRMKSFS
jgi:hypothetical protein